MEDLDGMIMDALRKLDCSFCNEISSISLMGLSEIVEAVVKLLWACDSKNRDRIKLFHLPNEVTVKYKAATTIANAIKELGIREEVGYQTLLYPNIYEIRQILISLIEKLPKQEIQASTNSLPLNELQAPANNQVQSNLKRSKYPCYCRYLMKGNTAGAKWHLKAHHPEFFNSSVPRTPHFHFHTCHTHKEQPDNADFSADEFVSKQSTSQSPSTCPDSIKTPAKPPPLPPKPKPRSISVDNDGNSTNEDTNLKWLQERKNALLLELNGKMEQLDDIYSLLHSLESEVDYTNAELSVRDDKLLQILRDPESQFPSLQNFINQASARRQELEKTFEEWKSENLLILNRLRLSVDHSFLSNAQRLEAQNKAEQIRRAIANQNRTLHKLQKQANSDVDTEGVDSSERTKFLSRIMYLVKSVNAQKEEILRSFADCQQLEKEQRQLDGNLNRTFTVVNSWLAMSAENDPILRKAHNLLSRMHAQCDAIIQSIQTIFMLNNATDEFQDQVELLSQQQANSALDQILMDFLRLKQENEELRMKIRQMR